MRVKTVIRLMKKRGLLRKISEKKRISLQESRISVLQKRG